MFEYDKINNYEYNLYLCNLDKTQICNIDYLDIQYNQNFLQYNELSFTVSETESGWRQVKNQYFNFLQPLYLILMEVKNGDALVFQEYFIVDSPSLQDDNGVIKKNIKCYSSDYVFNNYYLNSYEETKVLYDPTGEESSILSDMLNQMENTWTVNYMSDTLIGIYHTYNFSNSTFRSVIETLQEQFNVFFIFDTIHDQINIYDASEEGYGESTDIIISDENYLKSLSAEIKSSEMVNKLRVSGKDNVTIASRNPTGMMYLLDYSYAQKNNRMSKSLSDAYTAWLKLISDNENTFQTYLTNLNTLQSSLTVKNNELVDLETALSVIDDSLDVLIDNYRRNTTEYDTIYANKLSVLAEITSKKAEITNVESQIDVINTNIIALNTLLSEENNFTLTQRQELSRMTIQGPLKLDFVSDVDQLYTYAKRYQTIKNKPSIDANLNIVDLFSISDSFIESKYNKIKVGNYLFIDCASLDFNYEQYRITQISHSKLSNSLNITISNKDRLNTEIYYLNRIFATSSKAADDLNINKEDYSKYTKEANTVLYNYSTIDTSTNEIKAGDNVINRRGFLGNSLGSRNGAIKIQGDQIVFSPDGNFQNYYSILSSDGLYLETNDVLSRTVITPSNGIQIDKNVGTASSPIWDNVVYISSEGHFTIDGGYIELLTSNNLNKILIDPSVGFKLQKSDGAGGFVDTFYVDVETGDAVFSGMIATLTDALVGNNLYIGNFTDTGKSIVFFNEDPFYCRISFEDEIVSGQVVGEQLIIDNNTGSVSIITPRSIELNAAKTVNVSGKDINFYCGGGTDDGMFKVLKFGNQDLYLEHGAGTGDIWLQNNGSGRIKIKTTTGDISVASDSGTTWLDGINRISSTTYSGGYDETNRIINKGEIQTLINSSGFASTTWVSSNFASSSHSHGYATSSDISSAISAHVSAYHSG